MNKRSNVSLIKKFILHDKLMFLTGVSSVLITTVCVLSFGFIVRNIVNAGLFGDKERLIYFTYMLVFSTFIMCIFAFFRSFSMNMLAEKVCQAIKIDFYKKVLSAKLENIQQIGYEKVINVLSGDIKNIRTGLGSSFPFLIRSCITLLGSIGIILSISMYLTGVVILTIMLIILPALILTKLLKSKKVKSTYINDKIDKLVFDTVYNVKYIKSNLLYKDSINKLNENSEILYSVEKRRIAFRSLFISICILAVISAVSMAIIVGFREVSEGNISAGDITSFIIYSIMIALGLGGVSEHGSEFFQIRKVYERINYIQNNMYIESDSKLLDISQINSIDIVNFKLNRFGSIITIPKISVKLGDVVIFESKSGSGKSSLFDILLKYITIENEKIMINNIDINLISHNSIRNLVAYSFQNDVILSRTLMDNITFYNDLEKDLIISSLNNFNLLTLIPRLNENVENFSLSGGEKKRIAILRTLLQNKDMFIFDEPTNNLDSQNIDIVMKNISNSTKNKIVFIAAHDINIRQYFQDRNVIIVNTEIN